MMPFKSPRNFTLENLDQPNNLNGFLKEEIVNDNTEIMKDQTPNHENEKVKSEHLKNLSSDNFSNYKNLSLDDMNSQNKKDDEDEINALMVASTSLSSTVRVKTNKKQKQLREMESIVELLAPDPSTVIEDKAFGVAQAYFIKLKERLEENEKGLFDQVLEILDSFDPCTSTATELYYKFANLLSKHPDLVLEFLLFLLPSQALECGRFIEYLMLTKMSDFLRKMEKQFAKSPHIVRKFYSSLTTLSQQSNVTLEEVRSAIIPLFKGNSVLIDSFNQILPSEDTPNSLLESSFEMVPLRHDPFSQPIEMIPTPAPVPDAYGGESCLCACHSMVPLDKYRTRTRHCIPCGTKFIRGKVFVETGKGIRCASVMFNGKLPKCHMKRLANRASKKAPTYTATNNMRRNVWQQLPIMRLRYNMINIAERGARLLEQEDEEELARREEEKRAEEEAARRAAEDSARYAAEALEATKRAEEASKRAEKAAVREAEKRAARVADAAREAAKHSEIPETGETVIEAVRQAAAARHAELEAAKQAELAASGQSLISEIKVQVHGHSITEAMVTIRSTENVLNPNFITCQEDKNFNKIEPSIIKINEDVHLNITNNHKQYENTISLDMPQLELGSSEEKNDSNTLRSDHEIQREDTHSNNSIENKEKRSINFPKKSSNNPSENLAIKEEISNCVEIENINLKFKEVKNQNEEVRSLPELNESFINATFEDNMNLSPEYSENSNKELNQKLDSSSDSLMEDFNSSSGDSSSSDNITRNQNNSKKTTGDFIKYESSVDDFVISSDSSENEDTNSKQITEETDLVSDVTTIDKTGSQQEDFVISSGDSSGTDEEPESESYEFQPKKARLELSDSEDEQDTADITPGQGWTRQEDKIILEMFQQEGSSEETLIKIAERLSTRPIPEIRHRFQHLINLLLEMTGVGVDE